MNIMRFLLLVIAIFIGFMIVKHFMASRRVQTKKKLPESTPMVRCEQCGVHLPRQDAISADGKYYCNDEHRRLHHD